MQEWALVGLHQPAQLPMSLSPGLAWRLALTQSEPTSLERLFGEAFREMSLLSLLVFLGEETIAFTLDGVR